MIGGSLSLKIVFQLLYEARASKVSMKVFYVELSTLTELE